MPKTPTKNIYSLALAFEPGRLKELATAITEGFNFEPVAKDKYSGLQIVATCGYWFDIYLLMAAELLLEGGGDPLRPHPDGDQWKSSFPLLEALNRRRLGLAFLMLWYTPRTCDTILVERRLYSHSFTNEFEIKLSVAKDAKEPFPSLECFTEIATQAYRYQTLLKEAQDLEEKAVKTKEDFIAAAERYAEAATIFKWRIEHEAEIVYPASYDCDPPTPKQLHAFFNRFYIKKYWVCKEQEWEQLVLAETVFAEANHYPDQALIDQHVSLLNQLIGLANSLGKETERRVYLKRVAEVIMRTPTRTVTAADAVVAARAAVMAVLPARGGAGDDRGVIVSEDEVHLGFVESKDEAETATLLSETTAVASVGAGRAVEASGLLTWLNPPALRHRHPPAADAVGVKAVFR